MATKKTTKKTTKKATKKTAKKATTQKKTKKTLAKAPQETTVKQTATKKATAKKKKATGIKPVTQISNPSRVAKPIKELKPGWTSRVFHLETASLIACDALWHGTNWQRGDKFSFLYRSKRGNYFVLHDVQNWSIATDAEARQLFLKLPEKLVSEKEAFAPITIEALPPPNRDEDEDTRRYKVVRNDKWEFSIWLDHKSLPRGWYHIGVTGLKNNCLEFVNQNCVFGAPNPGMP